MFEASKDGRGAFKVTVAGNGKTVVEFPQNRWTRVALSNEFNRPEEAYEYCLSHMVEGAEYQSYFYPAKNTAAALMEVL